MENKEIIKVEAEVVQSKVSSLERAESLIYKINDTGNMILSSVDNVTQTIKYVKELDNEIRQIELQFQLRIKEYDMKIEKIKSNSQIINTTLQMMAKQVDKLLDSVLEMDINNHDENYNLKRSELLSTVRNVSDNLSAVFISFLKY